MIPLVEDYLSDLLADRFGAMKANPNLVGKILNINQNRLTQLSNYLQSNSVKIIKGYPRTPTELPCICILLAGEQESQEGLGDYSDFDDISTLITTDNVPAVYNAAGRLAVPYVQVEHFPILSVKSVINITTGVEIPEEYYFIANDSLGLVALVEDADVQDEDMIRIEYEYINSSTNGMQTLYECNYRLEAWSQNGDLTVDLYHLTKYALLWGRDKLGKDNGIVNQKLGGSDFEPATAYFPEFVYRRGLSFWGQFTASIPTDDDEYIQGVEYNQTEIVIDGSGQ